MHTSTLHTRPSLPFFRRALVQFSCCSGSWNCSRYKHVLDSVITASVLVGHFAVVGTAVCMGSRASLSRRLLDFSVVRCCFSYLQLIRDFSHLSKFNTGFSSSDESLSMSEIVITAVASLLESGLPAASTPFEASAVTSSPELSKSLGMTATLTTQPHRYRCFSPRRPQLSARTRFLPR